jgi:hypothetical protein
LQSYCAALYSLFEDNAIYEEVDDSRLLVWRGRLTHATKEVSIPDGVYKRVMNQLRALGCIEQVEQGRGSLPTVIILFNPPTMDVWQDEIISRQGLTHRDESAILRARLDDMDKRLGGLDIVQALVEIQKQHDDFVARFNKFVSDVQPIVQQYQGENIK